MKLPPRNSVLGGISDFKTRFLGRGILLLKKTFREAFQILKYTLGGFHILKHTYEGDFKF